MEITSDAPHNLFVSGESVVMKVENAESAISYELINYFDTSVAKETIPVNAPSMKIALGVLQPGWYRLRCKDNRGEVEAVISVVMDRKGAALPLEGRVCFDGIGSANVFAYALAKGGIPWIRDRMWWKPLQLNEGDPIDWKWYPESVETLHKAGIRVCQMWNDCPDWMKRKNVPYPEPAPEDLLQHYNFAKEMAKKFGDAYKAFAPGNEPDWPSWGSSWSCKADRYAAHIKAVSLGIKSVHPDAIILDGSMSWGVTPFMHIIYDSGIGNYTDAFDWHFYGGAEQYAMNLDAYRRVLAEYGAENRPAWVTEGGISLPATSGPNGNDLSLEHQKQQCHLAVRNVTLALAGGTDKYFYFCLQNYVERGFQFGVAYANNTLYPAFIAMSALANHIGDSEYIGQYKNVRKSVSAYAFSTPKGIVLMTWAETPTKITVPVQTKEVRIANMFGAEESIPVSDGKAVVPVGTDTVYVLNVDPRIKNWLRKPRFPTFNTYPQNHPSKIVLMGYSSLPINGDRCCYLINGNKTATPFEYRAEVVNFNEDQSVSGTVWLDVPEGWSVNNTSQPVELKAMEKKTLLFTITPTLATTLQEMTRKVYVRGKFGEDTPSPSVSYFGTEPSDLTPAETKPVPWGKAYDWKPDGTSFPAKPLDNKVHFESTRTSGMSFWRNTFETPMDLREYDGLAFDVELRKPDILRLMLVETSGAHYFATIVLPEGETKRRVTILFKDIHWWLMFASDPNGRLDLDKIAAVKIGQENSPQNFTAGNFELIKMPK